jgi:predicted SAM-dependent methyltransferase
MLDERKLQEMFSIPQEKHPERLFVLNEIGEIKDKLILDIGCGRNKTISESVGIDIIDGADIKTSGDDLKRIGNEWADVIISRHSFEHILNSVKAIKEWLRVLKQGGKIIMILPDYEKIDTMDMRLSQGQHLHAYTRESLSDLLNLFKECVIIKKGDCVKDWSFYITVVKI